MHQPTHRADFIIRSVHNTRIERLWVDVKVQVVSKWANFFSELELRQGLNADNPSHIWLLQYLFLQEINQELQHFQHMWNNHLLRQQGERAETPLDIFEWDMQVCGIRGDMKPEGELFIAIYKSELNMTLAFYRLTLNCC